jgi:hypothetical protein
MYIVGHCHIAQAVGLLSDPRTFGDDAVVLMLPDIVRCHDWGYSHCFDPPPRDRRESLVRAHMLGDWYVHYGDERRMVGRRGWAYRRMGHLAREYDDFFEGAERLGLRNAAVARDSARGFAHTMMEYLIDQVVAECGSFDAHFASVKAALGVVGSSEGVGSLGWLTRAVAALSIECDASRIPTDAADFGARVRQSTHPREFALRAGAKKFALRETTDAMEYVGEYLRRASKHVTPTEVWGVLEQASVFTSTILSSTVERSEQEN